VTTCMQVRAVLFDLFNTLILLKNDDAFYMPSLIKLHKSLLRNGVTTSFDDFSQAYFETRDKLYAETEKRLEEPHFNIRVSQTLRKFGYDFGASHPIVTRATEAFSEKFIQYAYLEKDTKISLEKLHTRYKLGVVSNFNIPELVGILLEKFGLNEFFDVVVISGAVNIRKPSLEIFQKAIKTLQIEPSEAVYVGDTLSVDVKGAKNAGMRSILIRRNSSVPTDSTSFIYKPRDYGVEVQPDGVVESLKELQNLLEDC
jgi:HAD superfamily hydrolase (TIGR01662 family)